MLVPWTAAGGWPGAGGDVLFAGEPLISPKADSCSTRKVLSDAGARILTSV